MEDFRVNTRIDHLFSVDVDLESWGFYPSVAGGVRVNTVPTGGIVFDKTGEIGKVVPGGEVNALLRHNGVFELSGGMTLKLDNGNLVYLPYDGRSDFCAREDIKKFASGEMNGEHVVYLAIAPESTDARIDKQYAFAVGKVDDVRAPKKMCIDIYEYECLPL